MNELKAVEISDNVKVHCHACGADGIFVNAFLVETANGVVAVDSTLTVSTARAFRERFLELKKPLLAVFVTHPHPDHVAGLAEFVTSDDVPVFATQPVDDLMRELEGPKREQWGPVYKEEWVARWRYPNRIVAEGATLSFDGVSYRVHDVGFGGDSEANSIWTMEGPGRTAFLSDLVFNGVHPYLADGGVLAWLANLERAERLCAGMRCVFPGHGPAGPPSELIANQRAYLLEYIRQVQALAQGRPALGEPEQQELTRRMTLYLSNAGLEFLIGMGANRVAAELAVPKSVRPAKP